MSLANRENVPEVLPPLATKLMLEHYSEPSWNAAANDPGVEQVRRDRRIPLADYANILAAFIEKHRRLLNDSDDDGAAPINFSKWKGINRRAGLRFLGGAAAVVTLNHVISALYADFAVHQENRNTRFTQLSTQSNDKMKAFLHAEQGNENPALPPYSLYAEELKNLASFQFHEIFEEKVFQTKIAAAYAVKFGVTAYAFYQPARMIGASLRCMMDQTPSGYARRLEIDQRIEDLKGQVMSRIGFK